VKKVVAEAMCSIHGNVNYLLELRELARKNRKNPTEAEEVMWQRILRYNDLGYKFTRQKPIGRFIVDFYCSKLNLAIEIDGSSHDKRKGYDQARDLFLKQIGIKTIRFTNEEVLNNTKNLRKKIFDLIASPVKGR